MIHQCWVAENYKQPSDSQQNITMSKLYIPNSLPITNKFTAFTYSPLHSIHIHIHIISINTNQLKNSTILQQQHHSHPITPSQNIHHPFYNILTITLLLIIKSHLDSLQMFLLSLSKQQSFIIMEGALRKVEFYIEGKHYAHEFPNTYTLINLEEQMKTKPDFIHLLQQNQKSKIPATANLIFRYMTMESQPTSKILRLNEFHPKKRLIFYVQIVEQSDSFKQAKKEPIDGPKQRVKPPEQYQREIGRGGASNNQNENNQLKTSILTVDVQITDANDAIFKVQKNNLDARISEIMKKANIVLQDNNRIKYSHNNVPVQKNYSDIKNQSIGSLFNNQPPHSVSLTIMKVFVAGFI